MARHGTALVCFALAAFLGAAPTSAMTLPDIRASASNSVPACVTPSRLMTFLRDRNAALATRFANLAGYYEAHGRALKLRWDLAFFQMLIETNWMRFHQPNGRPGLVSPEQNNFAGLGATGRGQSGEHFPDVSTGVLAHLQHILMYSGEHIEKPVANRTRLVQEWGEIPAWARGFRRPVTFTDLTRKWSPYDRGYSDDIRSVAERFRESHCGMATAEDDERAPLTVTRAAAAPLATTRAANVETTGAVRPSVFRKLQ